LLANIGCQLHKIEFALELDLLANMHAFFCVCGLGLRVAGGVFINIAGQIFLV
jgi:hypothetical protein